VTPIDRFIAALESHRRDPRKKGNGWEARCPAHDDNRPSLGVSVGDDGKVLLNCRAGCDYLDVIRELGLEEQDLFPPSSNGTGSHANGSPKGLFSSFDAAVEWVARKDKLTAGAHWPYTTLAGSIVFHVQRFNHPDGSKSFRPVKRVPGGWRLGNVDKDRPLYRLPEVLSCPLSGAVSSTINGTVTGPTTGTDGTIHVYIT
jgi:putative DNA primase/helicase